MKTKTFIITGFSEYTERDVQQHLHGMLVVTGNKEMQVIELEDGEDGKEIIQIIDQNKQYDNRR